MDDDTKLEIERLQRQINIERQFIALGYMLTILVGIAVLLGRLRAA